MAEAARRVPYGEVDLAQVREYVQGRTDRSSVRSVAGEIGMPHTSLEKFLDGSTPHTRNRILIIEWYLREHPAHPVRARLLATSGAQTPNDLAGHLDALLSPLAGEARAEARRKITTALAHAYGRMGLPDPFA
jgi:hypothetical protein